MHIVRGRFMRIDATIARIRPPDPLYRSPANLCSLVSAPFEYIRQPTVLFGSPSCPSAPYAPFIPVAFPRLLLDTFGCLRLPYNLFLLHRLSPAAASIGCLRLCVSPRGCFRLKDRRLFSARL